MCSTTVAPVYVIVIELSCWAFSHENSFNKISFRSPMSWYTPPSQMTSPATAGYISMGLLTDTYNCWLRMRRERRERFPRHRIQRMPLVSDPGMHHGTCVTHVPCCMSGSPIRGGGETVPGIPGACATHNFTYLARGPLPNCRPLTCNGPFMMLNTEACVSRNGHLLRYL